MLLERGPIALAHRRSQLAGVTRSRRDHNPDHCTTWLELECIGEITLAAAECAVGDVGCIVEIMGSLLGSCCPCMWRYGLKIPC